MPDLTSHGFFVRKPRHRGPQESSVLCQLRELLAGARCHEAILSLQAWNLWQIQCILISVDVDRFNSDFHEKPGGVRFGTTLINLYLVVVPMFLLKSTISKTLSSSRWFLYLWCFSVSGAGALRSILRWPLVNSFKDHRKTALIGWGIHSEVFRAWFRRMKQANWASVGRCDFVLAFRPGKVQEWLKWLCQVCYPRVKYSEI